MRAEKGEALAVSAERGVALDWWRLSDVSRDIEVKGDAREAFDTGVSCASRRLLLVPEEATADE